MNKRLILAFSCLSLFGCSPVKLPITNQYSLAAYTVITNIYSTIHPSILVSPPEAVAEYLTENMRYTVKPYELSNFAHNAWSSPPAAMLHPLIAQSLQRTGYFSVVAASLNSDPTDYRLDTQLIELKQNFLKSPVQLDFVVNVVLTYVPTNKVLASRLMAYHVNCPEKTPYGGVIAANEATKRFTAELIDFIMRKIKK